MLDKTVDFKRDKTEDPQNITKEPICSCFITYLQLAILPVL